MIKDFDDVSKQLRELADVINAFKSEAVQLRLVELLFHSAGTSKEAPEDKQADKPEGPRSGRRRRSRKKTPIENTTDKTAVKAKTTGRPGGKATLARLLTEGFFKKPRTIKQLVEHCDHNLALKYQQSDFSGALGRYVRDGKLKRTKNADKQYEYSES